MIAKSISVSDEANALGDFAALLFTWLIPHSDDYGVIPGSPGRIKALVVPRRKQSEADIEAALEEMRRVGLIYRYHHAGQPYIQLVRFEQHQEGLHKRTAPRNPLYNQAEASGSAGEESEPVAVLTSEGPEDESGWNAVDGDDATAWVGQQAGGGYLVVEYAPALELSGLEVDVAEGTLADAEVLYSLDAKDWQPLPEDLEANPVTLNFLWLAFPDDGTDAVPHVIEIRPNP